MDKELSMQEWLDQEPALEEIRSNVDGSRYIPIEFIKTKLDYMTDTEWQTDNFKHFLHELPDRTLLCSGSVELIVEGRTITGSATFDVQRYYPNLNYGAIGLSLCIVNSSQNLGRFFGKFLNSHLLTTPIVAEIKPLKSDKVTNTITSSLKKISK